MNARRLGTKLTIVATFVLGAVCAQQALAQQQPVAKLKNLQGTVLVSQGDAMTAGSADQALRPGTRVVTSAGSKVVVSYDKGCDVNLNENQRFTVKEFGPCAALIAAVEGTGAAGAAGAGAGGISTLAVVGGVAVVGGAAYAIDKNRRDNNVSGN